MQKKRVRNIPKGSGRPSVLASSAFPHTPRQRYEFRRIEAVIAKVISLRKDGDEKPQFYELAVKYDGVGAPHQTVVYGTEENVRELLGDGGIAGIEIDALFKTLLNSK